MASTYPPSPVPSTPHSLADIEDLDAFLKSQGHLSEWPTPPLADNKNELVVDKVEIESGSEDEVLGNSDTELYRIATALAAKASMNASPRSWDVGMIHHLLVRANVPKEVLAVAYNITQTFAASAQRGLYVQAPELAVAASLSLATAFTDDRDWGGSGYWAREVCNDAWVRTAHNIDAAMLRFLEVDGLSMLSLSSPKAIEVALFELCNIAGVPKAERDRTIASLHRTEPVEQGDAVLRRRSVSEGSAESADGEMTPVEASQEGSSYVLPLL